MIDCLNLSNQYMAGVNYFRIADMKTIMERIDQKYTQGTASYYMDAMEEDKKKIHKSKKIRNIS